MKIILAGLNHRTAPVAVRERFAFPEGELLRALQLLKEIEGVTEALVLSTCNRVEFALSTNGHPQAEAALSQAQSRLAAAKGASLEELSPHLYIHEDEAAIRHLFRVAASLDSMVLGEPQILGQLKAAYLKAKECGALGGELETALARAFSVAKRVRTETDIGRSAVSISYAAIELARQIFGNLKGRRVLLIGAGKMSELAARHLARAGCARIQVANRTRPRAEALAQAIEGEIVDYDTFRDRLPQVDIVLTSSGAPDPILTVADLKRAQQLRRSRPLFLIDIAVPRNIEPSANDLEGIFLYDIDDLGKAVAENLNARQREAAQAEALVDDEVRRLVARLQARGAAPLIVGLQQSLEQLAAAELERHRARFGDLAPQQQQALDSYTKGLLAKIAHPALAELRQAAATPDGEGRIALIRRLFRLDD